MKYILTVLFFTVSLIAIAQVDTSSYIYFKDSCYDVEKTDTIAPGWVIIADSSGTLKKIYPPQMVYDYKYQMCSGSLYSRRIRYYKHRKFYISSKPADVVAYKVGDELFMF